jgi:DNA-binding transcriptional regulator YbjK
LEDYELIAQELSSLAERFRQVENRVSDLLTRMTDVERVNGRLEGAALTTAQALTEISNHWEAVYDAMRRKDLPQEAAE